MKAADTDGLNYAIGDVHGRLDLLEQVMARCLADASQRGCLAPLFVLLGDYVDRGPDSAGVIKFIRALSRDHHIVALRGNHDWGEVPEDWNADHEAELPEKLQR